MNPLLTYLQKFNNFVSHDKPPSFGLFIGDRPITSDINVTSIYIDKSTPHYEYNVTATIGNITNDVMRNIVEGTYYNNLIARINHRGDMFVFTDIVVTCYEPVTAGTLSDDNINCEIKYIVDFITNVKIVKGAGFIEWSVEII